MPIEVHSPPDFRLLDRDETRVWSQIATPILGDELNRSNVMHAALRPLAAATRMAGQALTVECMAGDNAALHYALERLWPGAVIVADARGHVDTAVWGEIMHTCARQQGAAGVVIDGAMRDSTALARSGLPAYCRGICARGPHKGWGGAILGPIQCGGVAVHPGDLVVGDDDGVVVIRPDQLAGLLERCQRRMEGERRTLERVRSGETTARVLGMPPIERIGR